MLGSEIEILEAGFENSENGKLFLKRQKNQ